MKRVEVLLPPAQFDEVKDALLGIGIDSMTLSEVKHIDPGTCRREVFRDPPTSSISRCGSAWTWS